MIRAKCPKCAQAVQLADSAAGSVGTCPHCGQKFRVPAATKQPSTGQEAKTRPAPPPPRKPPAQDVVEGGYGVLAASDLPSPPKREDLPMPLEFRMMQERAAAEAEEAGEDSDDEPVEEVPRKRKKRKKKKPKQPFQLIPGMSNAHVAGLAGGLVGVVLISLLAFWIWRKATAPEPVEPQDVVIKAIEDIGGRVERDTKSPGQPVVGVTLNGTEARGLMVRRLRAFPQLQKLSLSGTKIADTDLDNVEDLTTLRVLNLSHTNITFASVGCLKALVNLEDLSLAQTLVNDIGLEHLKGLKKLKRINLDGTQASGLGLKAAIPDLEIIK